jgi:hypothetical protein
VILLRILRHFAPRIGNQGHGRSTEDRRHRGDRASTFLAERCIAKGRRSHGRAVGGPAVSPDHLQHMLMPIKCVCSTALDLFGVLTQPAKTVLAAILAACGVPPVRYQNGSGSPRAVRVWLVTCRRVLGACRTPAAACRKARRVAVRPSCARAWAHAPRRRQCGRGEYAGSRRAAHGDQEDAA